MGNSEVWNPWDNLVLNGKPSEYAIIVLNTAINFTLNPNILVGLWNKASIRVTVDGGTNRWLTWLNQNGFDINSVAAPHLVTGDMDSISKEILHYYMKTNKVTNVIFTPDQNETDFTKALREIKQHASANNTRIDCVYVVAEVNGRFDQIMANVATLFKRKSIMPDAQIYQVATESITWLLEPGSHVIKVPSCLRQRKDWCALIPVGSPCQVTTTGLKWNLNKSVLEFGKLVSTSNTYSGEPVVQIQNDSPVVWSMGVEGFYQTQL